MSAAAAAKIPTPTELRETMVEDYFSHAQRAGKNPTMADVEKDVAFDLQIYEAVEREKKSAPPLTVVPDEREDTAKKTAHMKGMDLYRKPVNEAADRRDHLIDVNPQNVSEKYAAMMARIKRIVAPKDPNAKYRGLRDIVRNAEHPVLAERWINAFLCYNGTPATSNNPFKGVTNPKDRARIFMRIAEDICDASTGKLGHWWVK